MRDNITKTYKKWTNLKINRVDLDAKKDCRQTVNKWWVDQLQKQTPCTYNGKDHRERFPHNPSFRLINPSKLDVGKVSKAILMHKEITSCIQVNQWKNSSVVIKWFRNIENKPDCSFIIFDIEDFYESILSSLFSRAIEYGKEIYNLSNDETSINMQSRKIKVNHGSKKMTRKISMYQ